MPEPVRVGILGLGGRGGETYGHWCVRHPDRARVVAVAEPLPGRRERFADAAGVPPERRFEHWAELFDGTSPDELDAIVVALPDAEHVAPTIAAVERGLPVLLEKPIATDEASLRDLELKLRGHQPRIAVCHVLRETPFWRSVHQVVRSGALGDLVTIRLEENIGFWHFAHSYVRGNWRNTAASSPMVLAKTCHDLDIIRWLADAAPERISSVGSLKHFRPENAPPGAPSHCVHGCPAAETCPFYAPRYYVERLADVHGWPVALLGDDTSREGRLRALAEGPYGRCVYRSDNDVVDHQQTIMEFPGGLTASLTTSAFTGENTRTFHITGTRGDLSGRMRTGELRLELFSPGPHEPPVPTASRHRSDSPMGHDVYTWVAGPERTTDADHRGHGGGDDALTDRFITAVASGEFERHITTTFAASLDSHWMAFAAERSRLGRTVVEFADVRP